MFGKPEWKQWKVHRLLCPCMLMLLLSLAGCATAEKEPLAREDDDRRVIAMRETVAMGTVVSSDTAGKKYIENYLFGSAPARTRVYGNVVFRIEKVMKGRVREPELKLRRELGLYDVIATTNSFLPRVGDAFLIGFDGRPSNPRKVMLVPIPTPETNANQ